MMRFEDCPIEVFLTPRIRRLVSTNRRDDSDAFKASNGAKEQCGAIDDADSSRVHIRQSHGCVCDARGARTTVYE